MYPGSTKSLLGTVGVFPVLQQKYNTQNTGNTTDMHNSQELGNSDELSSISWQNVYHTPSPESSCVRCDATRFDFCVVS